MTIRYRKLTADGDYTFGNSSLNFYTGVQAVAQAIQTRLQLYKESFWRDIEDGLPMFQNILGTPGSPNNLEAINGIIQQRISDTEGVLGITSFSSAFDRPTRQYSYSAVVQTIYSETLVEGLI